MANPGTQLVHVITWRGGRYEFDETVLPATFSDARIISELNRVKWQFGYNASVEKEDAAFVQAMGDAYVGKKTVMMPDKSSGFAFDHPDTIVAIGYGENGDFVEERRIKGPPKTDDTKSDETDNTSVTASSVGT